MRKFLILLFLMHVCVVTDTYVPDVNGAAKTLGHIVRELRAMEYRVTVIRTGVKPQDGSDDFVVGCFNIPGYPEIKIGCLGVFRMIERWKQDRPDAVYIGMESPMGCQAMKACKHMGIPVVAGFHTNFHQYTKCFRIGFLRSAVLRHIRNFHNIADVTLVPSPTAKNELHGLGFERLEVMGRGVDDGIFSSSMRCEELRKSWGADENIPVVIYVGRISPEKNLELFARCVDEMKLKRPDLITVVVGDGPSQAKFATQHPEYIYTKFLQGEDLGRAYASADVLVFGSVTETFGNTITESMASGLVTVGFDYASGAMMIEHGKNGFLAPFEDEQKLIEVSLVALEHYQDKELRQAAEKKVSGLSWDVIAERFLEVMKIAVVRCLR